MTSVIVCLVALGFLMFVAYRGYSVILFAPIAALGAVAVANPSAILPVYSGLFLESMAAFVKSYFPVFLLGALFGKVVELSGCAKSLAALVSRVAGSSRAILAIVLVCAALVYGGVSLFVVAFAVYPFAAVLFREADIPKSLIPGTIALGSFTFAMDAFPGSPQIQNIIPTTFFGTTTMAAPRLGLAGGLLIFGVGMMYLEWRRRIAAKRRDGYGTGHINEPPAMASHAVVHPAIAVLPLTTVALANFLFTRQFPKWYGTTTTVVLRPDGQPITQNVTAMVGLWAVEAALVLGILAVLPIAFRGIIRNFAAESRSAISGSLLAVLNTASEYGFGAVIAALPGFLVIQGWLGAITDPLVGVVVSIAALAGITGSAAGGLSIALGAMSSEFIQMANTAHIPREVLHRVAAMSAGSMDTLPHNGAVITLLTIAGLTHRQAYGDIFVITCLKTAAAFAVVGIYNLTGLV